jgi:uncharacterized protein (DUF4415 family)
LKTNSLKHSKAVTGEEERRQTDSKAISYTYHILFNKESMLKKLHLRDENRNIPHQQPPRKNAITFRVDVQMLNTFKKNIPK